MLSIGGVLLFIAGFLMSFNKNKIDFNKGSAFWLVGLLCCIPGFYYAYRIYRKNAKFKQKEKDLKNTAEKKDSNK